jgi:hypothetical protein
MRGFGMMVTVAALALAACSGGSEEADMVDTPDVTADVDKAFKPEPGLYKASMEADSVMGMTGSMTQTFEYCLTREEAEGGFEAALAKNKEGDCKYEKFALAGDKIDAVLACSLQGVTMRMEQTGTATPTSSDLEVKMTMNIPGMGERVTNAKVRHERIGECAK